MQTATRIGKFTTNLPPCCLQVGERIYLGTYQLNKDDGTRHGSVEVYDKDNLQHLSSVPTKSAILDIKISPHNKDMMVTAHSTGCLIIWNISEEKPVITNTLQLFDDDVLITSIFFNPTNIENALVTLTSGQSGIVNFRTSECELLNTEHSLECWTGSFGELGGLSNVVFTGGDDTQLIAHDLRTMDPIWTSKRHHEAGVVSILSPSQNWNLKNSNHLWTGSYDDNLRILDLRLIDKNVPSLIPGYTPKVLHQENLGGGVWRLIPGHDDKVLVCCMYDGARIVNISEEEGFKVEKYFKGDHESMCYGGDWANENKVVTCSFYDNVVQVWQP